MPASGHQDHTTSPSASAAFVCAAFASTAPRPTSVTIAKRPSEGRDGMGDITVSTQPSSEISENQKLFGVLNLRYSDAVRSSLPCACAARSEERRGGKECRARRKL